MKSKIEENKNSDWYKYYSSDFIDEGINRFTSIFYQVKDIIIKPDIKSILEFGTGRNVSKALIEHFGIKHYSVDFDDKTFRPDHVSTILEFDKDEKYDIVCAFQVLEHNPIETIGIHLDKLRSFSNKYVYVSLPFNGRWISINFFFNFMPTRYGRWNRSILFTWKNFFQKRRPVKEYEKRKNKYSPHWWEIGDTNMSKKQFEKIANKSGLKIINQFHNKFFPYHIFFLMEIDFN